MNEYNFDKIIVCLDMAGCPNRCKHCWIGTSPNGNLQTSDLEFVAEQFKPYSDKIEIYSWYREPDYSSNYKELWDLETQLSTEHANHFQLLSFWRIVRDPEYVKWAYSLGVRECQFTLFGLEEKTDYYTGRKNAFKEILAATEILIQNKIAPRWQIFINKDNILELPRLNSLIEELDIANCCTENGLQFKLFIHQGSCDGENEKLYDIRVTPTEIEKIPSNMIASTLAYFNCSTITDAFGETEEVLYNQLTNDLSTTNYYTKSPLFYVTKDFDVYPNITQPAPWWHLGNLQSNGIHSIIKNYNKNNSLAQQISLITPISEILKKCGNPYSQRLFSKEDYIIYLLNQYCKTYKNSYEN